MAKEYLDSTKIREAHFYNKESEVTPKGIFEIFYSNLDELVEYNRSLDSRRRKTMNIPTSELREDLFRNSTEKMRNSRFGLAALLHFDGGEKRSFQIKPRTNFDNTLKKRPNIVYLESEDGNNYLILREARNYEGDDFVKKQCRRELGKHYKPSISTKDLSEKIDEIDKKDIISIPEPNLILALEQLYAENIVRRITPRLKITNATEDNIWYIRNFLPSIRDSPSSVECLMRYVGNLHGLGLMDKVDSQQPHYCINRKGRVVNIDPDFFAHTSNLPTVDSIDWGEFKFIMSDFLPDRNKSPEYIKQRRRIMSEVEERMSGSNFLQFVPSNLLDAPALKFLSADNIS